MRILVTGGAGFIGSNFIHHMMKYSDSVILNYDKLTYAGNLNNLKDINSNRYSFKQADICDYQSFKKITSDFNPDVIINFSAETHVDNSIISASEFIQTNIAGTEVILRIVKDLSIKKLIHISTDEVYGSLSAPLEAFESSKFVANSPYSASKAAADMLCHANFITYQTPVIILRGSNCYGKMQFPEKFIPKSITNLLMDKPIEIYNTGSNIREWIYIEDFCRGIEIASTFGTFGEAYNLGGGFKNRFSNNIIAEHICKIFNKSVDKYIKYIADRAGHDQRYSINSEKLEKLGWQPGYSILDEGLKKTVEWYLKNEWWWKPLLK